jgi:hypothetical protein
MTATLYVREVPDEVHATLLRRAGARGLSLRQYVVSVLAEHCALPSMHEWLHDVGRLPPAAATASGAEAVRRSRAEDEGALVGGRRR